MGFTFNLAHPYAAGHICSVAEAAALNRALVRGTSKGLFKALTAASSASAARPLSPDERSALQQKGEDYIAEFALGFAEGHDRLRAIRMESERIAKQLLATTLNARGEDASALEPAAFAAEVARLAQSEKVRTEAERRVNVTQEIAQRAHSELLELDEGGG